ncbi:MAG: aspartate aminotransferase family protein [Pseudomonadota bacterium]
MAQPQHLYDTYNRTPFAVARGEGVWLYDEDGQAFLDFGSGIAVNVLGHAHPKLVDAVKRQAEKLWHTSNLYRIPGQERVADMLVAHTFAEKVFFTNSGAEALECAIKTARRYHHAKGDHQRTRIITFDGAFHGRTLATISAAGNAKYMEGFAPHMDGFDHLPFGDHDALKAAINEQTAAILVEPVQGEGGLRDLPGQCLTGLRTLCDEHGILLIYDEVQCGVGRTGKLFAYQHAADAQPDIMAIAKALGGGFPVGACLANAEAASGMQLGSHGSTYGGNPLAMAVCEAVLETVTEDGFLEHVEDMALRLKQGLASLIDRYPDVFDGVRGKGLLTGLKCVAANTEVLQALYAEHMLAVPAGDNVLRILPPLNATAEEIAEAVSRLDNAARAVRAAKAA